MLSDPSHSPLLCVLTRYCTIPLHYGSGTLLVISCYCTNLSIPVLPSQTLNINYTYQVYFSNHHSHHLSRITARTFIYTWNYRLRASVVYLLG
jgi:hypothetical protein